jgi:hypothetical protein
MFNWFWKALESFIKAQAKKKDHECRIVRGALSVQDNYNWARQTVDERKIPPDPPPL